MIKKKTNIAVFISGRGTNLKALILRSNKKSCNYNIKDRRAGDPDSLIAKATLAKKVIKWQAKYSDLDTIINTTLDAYKFKY